MSTKRLLLEGATIAALGVYLYFSSKADELDLEELDDIRRYGYRSMRADGWL